MCLPLGVLPLLLFVGYIHVGYHLQVKHTFKHKTEGMKKSEKQKKQTTSELMSFSAHQPCYTQPGMLIS